MARQVVSQDTMDVLNALAQAKHAEERGAYSAVEALRWAIPDDWRLYRSSGSCEVYETGQGNFVNLWIEGVESRDIEEGGAGFDDQIGWAFEENAS